MLHTLDAAGEVAVSTPSDLIPLDVLALTLEAPPAVEWATHLNGRGIAVLADDIGRLAITRADARSLISERRDLDARQSEMRKAADQRAIEADQEFRSRLWAGLPAEALPVGVAPAAAMLQASRDAQPRRRTLLDEALAGGTLAFHPIEDADDNWVVGGGDG